MNENWIGKGVKVPAHLRELFEDLAVDNQVLQAKYTNFCTVIQQEQKKLMVRSNELWAETFALLNLQGEWRYKDGFVHPIDHKEQK